MHKGKTRTHGKSDKVFDVLWKKFNEFRETPNVRQCVKFDQISNHLRRFFMDESDQKSIESGIPRWIPSFDEITTVYPNVKELHFLNEYILTEHVLNNLEKHFENKKKKGEESPIKKIVFLYHNYEEQDGKNKPTNLLTFKDPDKSIMGKVPNGWMLKHNKNGETGYKIRIYKS
eukprot:437832_1